MSILINKNTNVLTQEMTASTDALRVKALTLTPKEENLIYTYPV